MRRPRGSGQTGSVCQKCGQSFRHPARFAQKFCSRDCKYAAQATGATNWIGTFTCAVCGAEFHAARTLNRKTCSKTCQYKFFSATQRDPANTISTNCPKCGLEFTYDRSWPRTFCSRVCSGKANVANIPGFKPTRFTAICEACGDSFETTPAATRGRFCSQRCFGRWQAANVVGPAHPAWNGGHPYGPSWFPARAAVRLRDEVCLDCGRPPSSRRALDVHHLVPFSAFGYARHIEANDPSNLVALCMRCHIKREWATNWANGKPWRMKKWRMKKAHVVT